MATQILANPKAQAVWHALLEPQALGIAHDDGWVAIRDIPRLVRKFIQVDGIWEAMRVPPTDFSDVQCIYMLAELIDNKLVEERRGDPVDDSNHQFKPVPYEAHGVFTTRANHQTVAALFSEITR